MDLDALDPIEKTISFLKMLTTVVVINYNRVRRFISSALKTQPSISTMQTGRFFSLSKGRVGQYLSLRVLVVRTPFQKAIELRETCYFGFEKISQAQKFAQSLASSGYLFQLQQSEMLTQFPHEIKLSGNPGIAKTLAYWDRLDQKQLASEKAHSTPSRSAQNQRSLTRLAA